MIPKRHKKQLELRTREIAEEPRLKTTDQRYILMACVWAMADEFPDLSFGQIPSLDATGLLEFFCHAARHYYARNLGEATPASITSLAIRCPFSDAAIIELVILYERIRPIWIADKA